MRACRGHTRLVHAHKAPRWETGRLVIDFKRLVLSDCTQADFEKASALLQRCGKPCELGCVVSLDRTLPLVRTSSGQWRSELAACIKKSEDSIVAVGDWVALWHPEGHERARIEQILPRRSEIARVKRVARQRKPVRQVLAANVDTVLICQSLTGEGLDLHLLVRQMTAAAGCGARPVFVFTKGDLVESSYAQGELEKVKRIAGDVELLVVSSYDAASVEAVRRICKPEALLLGESGVGKSTLANALVGFETFACGEVRASDDKGRHTTVARRMVEVPGGGLIIDAPGLRTLQILDMQHSLERAFPDIVQAAQQCKFRDCTHTHEPGCAVKAAIAPERLDAYRSLAK